MRKENSSFISFDLASKLVISFSSIYYIQNATTGTKSKELTFARFVWLPQLIICVLLIFSSSISRLFLRMKNTGNEDSKYLYGDVFILTTIDKLLSIGYNGHLIIFFLTRKDIDLSYILDSAVVVAYLDTVYFNVGDWQQKLLRFWSIGDIRTNLTIQHLLCMFFLHNYESL